VLADEPTGNLDGDNSRKVLDLLLDTLKTYGGSLLLVTHDGELAKRMDRVLLLRNQKLQEILEH
jgi:ABC-type lipoprotein export system ATPase subunit